MININTAVHNGYDDIFSLMTCLVGHVGSR